MEAKLHHCKKQKFKRNYRSTS